MKYARAASGPAIKNGYSVIEGDGKNLLDLLRPYGYINGRLRRHFRERPPQLERVHQRVAFSVVDGWEDLQPPEVQVSLRTFGFATPTVEDAIRFSIAYDTLTYENRTLIFPHVPISLPRENGYGLRQYLLTASYDEQNRGISLGIIRYERSVHETQRFPRPGKAEARPLYVCRS